MKKLCIVLLGIFILGCSNRGDSKIIIQEVKKDIKTIPMDQNVTITGGLSNHGSILDAIPLRVLYENNFPNDVQAEALFTDNTNVYIITLNGVLVCYNSSFTKLWEINLGQDSFFPGIIKDNLIYLLTRSGKYYVLDNTGSLLVENNLEDIPVYPPLIFDSMGYTILENGQLVGFNTEITKMIIKDMPVDGEWILLDNNVFILDRGLSRVLSWDFKNDFKIVDTNLEFPYGISGGQKHIAISGKFCSVYYLETMERIFSQELSTSFIDSPSIDSGEILFYGSSGNIFFYDLEHRVKIWSVNISKTLAYKSFIKGNELFLFTKNSIIILDRATGNLVLEKDVNGVITSQPLLTHGAIYVPSSRGLIVYKSEKPIDSNDSKIFGNIELGMEVEYPLIPKGISLWMEIMNENEYVFYTYTHNDEPVEIRIFDKSGNKIGTNLGYGSYEKTFRFTLDEGEYVVEAKAVSSKIGDFSLLVK
jgi:hypothetical protein